jgi:ATP-binding cassette, subfamily C, bacteriocin exporter
MNLNHIKGTFIKTDKNSGFACIQSLINYYERKVLNIQYQVLAKNDIYDCSNFLKLHDTAKILGFDAECYEAETKDFKNLDKPLILLVNSEEDFQHFIICYGYDGRFLIGDPLWGLMQYTEEELQSIWNSNVVMTLAPNSESLNKKNVTKLKRTIFNQCFRENKPQLMRLLPFGILSVLFTFGLVFFLIKLFDSGFGIASPTHYLLSLFSIILIILVIFIYFFNRNALRFISQITKWFSDKTIAFFFNKLDNYLNTPAEILSEIESILFNYPNYKILILTIFYYLPVIFLTILFSAFIDIHIFFLLLLSSGAYFLCFRRYYKSLALKQDEVFVQEKIVTTGVLNIFNNIRLIKSQKESPFEVRVKEISSNHVESNHASDSIKSAVYFWCTIISILTMAGIIFLLGYENYHNATNIFGAIITSLLFVIFSILSVPSLFAFYKSKAAINNFWELYFYEQTVKKVKNDENSTENINIQNIKAKDLSIRYPGSSEILLDINFELEKGKIVAFYGVNGTGKTTLLKALSRNIEIESGIITINNISWENINKNNWINIIAEVSQTPQFIKGSVIDNICIGALPTEIDQILDFCEKSGFATFFQLLPKGYYTVIDDNFTFISKGIMQIILFARALYKNPKILLLDEPFVNLDTHAKKFILSIIQNLKQQLIIVLATADVQIAQNSDYIYVLDKSKIVLEGKPNNVMERLNEDQTNYI